MVSTADISYLVSQMQELVQTVSNATGGTGMGAGADTSRVEKSAWKKAIKLTEQAESHQKGAAKSQQKVADAISTTEKAHQDYIKRATKDAQTTAETVRDLHKASVTNTNKTASETLHNMDTLLQASSTLFQQATEPLSNKQLEKSFTKFSESLGQVDQRYQQNIKSLGDLYKAQEDLENAQKMSAAAQTMLAKNLNPEEIRARLHDFAKQLGASDYVMEMFNGNIEQAIEKSANLQKSFDQVNQELAETKDGFSTFNINLASAAYWGKQLAEEFASTAQGVARHGGQLENFLGSSLWGMSSEELSELQGQYRQTTLAFRTGAGTIDAWEQRVEQSRWQMAAFTGGLKESIQMNSQLVDLQRTLGDVSGNTAGYLRDQQGMFKNWNRVFGMTVDSFMAMNEQLMQSQNIRTQLFKMDQQRRTAYFKDLQLTYQRLRSQGLLHEQAMQTVEALSEIGGQDAKTRLEQAAKLQAVMGATGMGARGQEAATLLRGGLRGEGDQQRFSQILGQASKQISNQMASGFQQELLLGEMIKGTGLERLLGPQSAFADVEIQRGKALMQNVSATQNLTQELTNVRKQLETGPFKDLIGPAAGLGQMVPALFSGPIGTALTGAAQIAGTTAMGALGWKGMSGLLGGGGRGAAGAAGRAGGVLSSLGKFGAKGAGRLIPGVGLVLGAGAAAKDFGEGDITGGILNTVGGVASLFPGIGTAIAAGTMGGDVAREYMTSDKKQSEKEQRNIVDVLNRQTQLLEEIEQNTESTRDVADYTRSTKETLNSQKEQQKQRQDEVDAYERRRKALSGVDLPFKVQ